MSGPEDRAVARVDGLARSYGITDEAARAAVEDTYRAVASYSGPALTAITADILDGLREDLEAWPRQVSVFVGRDGFPLAEAARGLDPEFVAENTRTVALSRVVIEQALRDLETYTGRELGLPPAFRLGSAPDAARPGAYRQLSRYLHACGVPAGRDDSAVALVDTSYKGTSQEMLAAAYPTTAFSGHYAFFGAHPADPHPGTKTGHALHRDPDPDGGFPVGGALAADPALTYTHPEAIAALEDLHHGPLAKPRAWEQGVPALRRMRTEDAELADINPARLAPGFSDPLTREACHVAALRAVADVAAAAGELRRAGDPDWRAGLDEQAAAFTDQLRRWITHPDPASRSRLDPRLGRALDGFVHREERDALQRIDAQLAARGVSRDAEPARRLFGELAVAGTHAEREQVVLAAGRTGGPEAAPTDLRSGPATREHEQAAPERRDTGSAGRALPAGPEGDDPGSPTQPQSQAGREAAREARERTGRRQAQRAEREAESHRRRSQPERGTGPAREHEQRRDY